MSRNQNTSLHRSPHTFIGAAAGLVLFFAAFVPAARHAGADVLLASPVKASVVMRAVTACTLIVGGLVLASILAAVGAAVAEAIAIRIPRARRGGGQGPNAA